MDGKDELIIFSPYWGTCGFRIYDIRETSRKIQLKSISKEKLDQAIRLLIAPKEGVLLCWWRNSIYKYKILKNAARSIIKLKEVDNVWSEITDLFLSYTIVFQKVCKSQIFYFCNGTFKNEYLWNLHMNKSRK